jgi:integrase/recombinase XerD
MKVQILSPGETEVLLTYLDKCDPRDELMVRLMLQCGLRIGEVSALNVGDVWRSGYVHPAINVRQGTTKGHHSRHVDIPEQLRALLDAFLTTYPVYFAGMSKDSPLFLGYTRKTRLGVSGIWRIIRAISVAALGRSIHPHLLRHTYATILLKYTNIRVVQELLGHASISTTQIYTHVSSEDCKHAVNQAFTR